MKVLAFPDPIEVARIVDPEIAPTVRRLDCRLYGHCLNVAEREGWDGFSCRACKCYQRLSPFELLADVHPLINCMAEALRRGHTDNKDPEPAADRTRHGRRYYTRMEEG